MDKTKIYDELLLNAQGLIDPQVDNIANMANIAALLYQKLNHHWIGFYRVFDNQLILGPFVGPVACTRIGKGKGVCGTCWQNGKSIIVNDVNEFPGHIACSPYSKSEIVIPCIKDNEVYAVLDIDSTELNAFDEIDQRFLEQVVNLL